MPQFQQAPPKYIQIADYIRAQIDRGELQPGDEVPSERQLAIDWDVARPTATKALDLLRREGHLVGRQGSGTYVAHPTRVHRQASDRYRRSSETGRIYPQNERARILVAEVVAAPEAVAETLGLSSGSRAIRRQRLTLRDGEPVELSTSWYGAELETVAPRLVARDRILEGTIAYVEGATGRRASVAHDRISARLANDEERQLLLLEDPSAVLVTHHVVVDLDGETLEFVEASAPPDAWTIEHEYQVGR